MRLTWPRRALRAVFSAVVLAGASAGFAGAQLQITFYDRTNVDPGPVPDPTQPYPGGPVLCTATAAGGPTGFSLNFADATAVNALCGTIKGAPAADRINNAQPFGARITGSLVAPVGGTYAFFVDVDDGNVVTINGITYRTDWVIKASGPGEIGDIPLVAGANPFIVDYFQGPCCGAYITVEARGNVVIAPPEPSVVPEPSSVALVGAGLAGLGAVLRRRRPA